MAQHVVSIGGFHVHLKRIRTLALVDIGLQQCQGEMFDGVFSFSLSFMISHCYYFSYQL